MLHTRARHEKKLAEKCGGIGAPFFLPTRTSLRRYRGRTSEVQIPLFPGYIFCRFSQEKRQSILCTRHVARIIRVPDQDGLLGELLQIERALEAGAPLEPHPCVKRGTHVRIRSGPFKDIEGVVSRRRNRHRIVLGITFIGKATSLEVGLDMIEPV
ncbi:transcription termination/antitermination protein NusG [Thermodesulfobacteriota bacterium]